MLLNNSKAITNIKWAYFSVQNLRKIFCQIDYFSIAKKEILREDA